MTHEHNTPSEYDAELVGGRRDGLHVTVRADQFTVEFPEGTYYKVSTARSALEDRWWLFYAEEYLAKNPKIRKGPKV